MTDVSGSIKEHDQNKINPSKFFSDSANVLLLILVLLGIVYLWGLGRKTAAIDFYQFWVISQAINQTDTQNIYSDSARRKIGTEFLQKAYEESGSERQIMAAEYREALQTYSTPLLYSVFYLFASGDYDIDLRIHNALSLTYVLLAIIMLCRLLRYSLKTTLAVIIIISVWFEPLFSDIRVGNVNRLQLGLLALFLCFQSKHTWRAHNFIGGLILGFSIMFKPNLVFVAGILVISWVINRRYRKLVSECAGILTAAVGTFIYSSIFFGSPRCWTDWFDAIRIIPSDIITIRMGNHSLARLIFDWTGVQASIYLVIFFSVLTIIFTWLGRRPAEKTAEKITGNESGEKRALLEDVLMVSTGCLIYLLSAPLVWLHYFMLTVPIMLFAFRPLDSIDSAKAGELLTRRIIPAIATLGLMLTSLIQMFKAPPVYLAIMTCVSTLILFGLSLQELLSLRKNHSVQTEA